jgi:hypothetical protein
VFGQDITTTGNDALLGGTFVLWVVIAYVLTVIPYFGIFKKAERPTWAAFVPIYNVIVLIEVAGKPAWWFLLLLIPIVNIVILIIVLHHLSMSFGHGGGFTVGLIFLSWIFLMILAFGSSRYIGASGQVPPPPPPA